jgi:hypothetical protein
MKILFLFLFTYLAFALPYPKHTSYVKVHKRQGADGPGPDAGPEDREYTPRDVVLANQIFTSALEVQEISDPTAEPDFGAALSVVQLSFPKALLEGDSGEEALL